MNTPLDKARRDPESMKARILSVARRLFGEYGFHGTTTRMIARGVGIDISTLHYHWGGKKDLYESVVIDINKDLRKRLVEVEAIIHGLPLSERLNISLVMMTDYLFSQPSISNLIFFQCFAKNRYEGNLDFSVPEFTADIAFSMGLSADRRNVSAETRMKVIAIMNSIHNFISGEEFFRPMLGLNHKSYQEMVKETLKFIFIPAFTKDSGT